MPVNAAQGNLRRAPFHPARIARRLMQFRAGRRQHLVARRQAQRPALPVGNDPAGPFDNGHMGAVVIGVHIAFDDQVDLARCQHRVLVAFAAVMHELHGLAQPGEAGAFGLDLVEHMRRGRPQHRVAKAAARRRADRRLRSTGGPAGGAGPALAGHRLVDDPQHRLPPCVSAISVPKTGTPLRNALVPSTGSSTHTIFRVGRSRPCSSPTTPWSGKAAR